MKSEIETLKSDMECVVKEMRKDKLLVMDLDRKTEVLNGVCSSVMGIVKDGIVGLESKLAEAQVRHPQFTTQPYLTF